MGELWAWPSALKLALVEHLRVRADVLAATRRHRRHADRAGQRARARRARRARLAGAGPSGVRDPAAAAIARVRATPRRRCAHSSTRRWPRAARRSRTRSAPRGATRRPNRRSMANLIGSLRLISTFDWSEFFESVSLVEHVLQRDPAGVYGRMDFRSRDRYRHAVEELAEPTGDGQVRVALKSVERARQVAEAHAGGARGARRLLPDRRAAGASSNSGIGWEPGAGAACPARVLSLRHAGLSRHDRASAPALLVAGRARLCPRARLARADARRRRAADASFPPAS